MYAAHVDWRVVESDPACYLAVSGDATCRGKLVLQEVRIERNPYCYRIRKRKKKKERKEKKRGNNETRSYEAIKINTMRCWLERLTEKF